MPAKVYFNKFYFKFKAYPSLADVRGTPGVPPTYRSRFFHFEMQNFRNVATLGVHGPPMRSTPPLWETLDPPLPMFYLTHTLLPPYVLIIYFKKNHTLLQMSYHHKLPFPQFHRLKKFFCQKIFLPNTFTLDLMIFIANSYPPSFWLLKFFYPQFYPSCFWQLIFSSASTHPVFIS